MNPLNIFQMMKNGNPQQFLQQMMGNNQVMRNPLMKNVFIKMIRSKERDYFITKMI